MVGVLALLPITGIAWWLMGFPPGLRWIVVPMLPRMSVSLGMLAVLATIVVGCYGGLAWLREHL